MGLAKYAKGSIFGKTEDIEEYKDIYAADGSPFYGSGLRGDKAGCGAASGQGRFQD